VSRRVYSPETQCHGKRPYPSKAAAKQAARHVEHHIGRTQAYHCSYCGAFHIGHKPAAPYDFGVNE
jgi:hypothetical protein